MNDDDMAPARTPAELARYYADGLTRALASNTEQVQRAADDLDALKRTRATLTAERDAWLHLEGLALADAGTPPA